MIYTKWLPEQLENEKPEFVIIGAGPAGIISALHLARNKKKVLLLEGGAENYTEQSQARYSGQVSGFDWERFKYLDGLRLRYLGGTSNHWVGYCARLDKLDLQGWPISHEELYKHSEEVEKILEIESFAVRQKEIDKNWPERTQPNSNIRLTPILKSPPVRFKTKYKKELEENRYLSVYLNANLVDIKLNKGFDEIESILIGSNPKSAPTSIKTPKILFCMGAIEITRHMLILRDKYKKKDDWGASLVGEGFMEHPHYDWDDPAAYVMSPRGSMKKHGFSLDLKLADLKFMQAITPSAKSRADDSILNYAFTLFKPEPPIETTPQEKSFYEFMNKIKISGNEETPPKNFDIHVVNLQTEMDANSGSKIALNHSTRDDFGLPRVILEMKMSKPVEKTVKTAIHNLQQELSKINALLFRVNDSPASFMGGAHPMGTTKMGFDLKTGFVDRNLRIFGLSNSYICSGSVFYSGGYANPTYTIANLAYRLATHLIDT